MTLRDKFPRTECDCAHCQVGCRTMPGALVPGDVARIVDHQIGIASPEAEQFILTHFVASEGARVAKLVDCRPLVFDIPSITPAQKPNGECVFFAEGRCTIHAVSPAGCALVDTHMTRADGDAVIAEGLREQIDDLRADGPYSRLWQHLKENGRLARPRLERRSAFEREFAALGRCRKRNTPQPLDA